MDNNEKKQKTKTKSILTSLLKNEEIANKMEEALKSLTKNEKQITIKNLVKLTALQTSDIKILLPFYAENKRCRMELRCSWIEKFRWENKAEKAGKSVSQLATDALSGLTLHIPRTEQLRSEINEIVSEMVRFNNLVDELVRWCELNKSGIEQVEIIALLNELLLQFDFHDQKIMAAINKKHVFDGLGTQLLTDGVTYWETN